MAASTSFLVPQFAWMLLNIVCSHTRLEITQNLMGGIFSYWRPTLAGMLLNDKVGTDQVTQILINLLDNNNVSNQDVLSSLNCFWTKHSKDHLQYEKILPIKCCPILNYFQSHVLTYVSPNPSWYSQLLMLVTTPMVTNIPHIIVTLCKE